MTHARDTSSFRRPAFTLVELIVVTVILAVLAGAIVPRIVARESRTARDSAEGARALLWDPLESTCRHASLSIL